MDKQKQILIVMRHGERTDLKGLVPQFGKHDPELTKHGEEQAFEAGKLISKELTKLKIPKDNSTIQIISSPLVRTLQTSRGVLRGIIEEKVYNISDTINVDFNISEIGSEFPDTPKKYLNILNETEMFKKEFANEKLKLISNADALPNNSEDEPKCYERVGNYLKKKIPELLTQNEYNITILVSHGEPVNEMNKHLNHPGPYGWWTIKYCHNFYYELDPETKQAKYITNALPPQ